MTELRECPNPWCDGFALVESRKGGFFRVGCSCGVAGPPATSEENAVSLWNTRPTPPPADEQVETVVGVVELADAWDDQARSAEPEARRQTLQECAIALRMLAHYKRAALASIQPSLLDERWQPIETAPRDGTDVFGWFLFRGDIRFRRGIIRSLGDGWSSVGLPVVPTHWMPLPDPPRHTTPEQTGWRDELDSQFSTPEQKEDV